MEYLLLNVMPFVMYVLAFIIEILMIIALIKYIRK
jgi:hypothetical protein